MKSLVTYIQESLDDNIDWLLDKWFERNEQQKSEFIEIVIKCSQEGRKVNIDSLKKYLQGTSLERQLKEFVNFIDNEVFPDSSKDYLYVLKQIIEQSIGKNMYTSK